MSEDRIPFWSGALSFNDSNGPNRYLGYLADCLRYGLNKRERNEKIVWWATFRRFTDEMEIASVECHGISFDDEVRAVISPDNFAAVNWSRACIEYGLARAADPDDPDSVISRLYWPTWLSCTATDD